MMARFITLYSHKLIDITQYTNDSIAIKTLYTFVDSDLGIAKASWLNHFLTLVYFHNSSISNFLNFDYSFQFWNKVCDSLEELYIPDLPDFKIFKCRVLINIAQRISLKNQKSVFTFWESFFISYKFQNINAIYTYQRLTISRSYYIWHFWN